MGWLLVVTACCGVSDALALPDAAVWLGMPMSGHEMFRPEWLVAGALIALPLYRTARASLFLGTVAFLLSSGEMFTIVDNARGRFDHNAVLFGGGPDFPTIYYAVAALQITIFLVATVKGAQASVGRPTVRHDDAQDVGRPGRARARPDPASAGRRLTLRREHSKALVRRTSAAYRISRCRTRRRR